MSEVPAQAELVVLTACRNGEYAIRGILSRPQALRIRPVIAEFHVHPDRDPGVLNHAHEFLRAMRGVYRHALVLLDREGSGSSEDRASMEADIEGRLVRSGWDADAAAAVVADPELECWVWSDSPHVERALGWAGRVPALRDWLASRDFAFAGKAKPVRPKEALEAALREARKPRSSAIYLDLAQKVSLERCTDPAFLKLREVLRRWFSQD